MSLADGRGEGRGDGRGDSGPDAAAFAAAVLDWYVEHGRRDLPWQRDATAYRVWVSEVMLQQTQVATVIGYFDRFMARFADLHALAAADVDEVLSHWSGLGYYARGRNLHRAAQLLVARHGGEFPDDIDALQALPGIGRSTAAAVLSLSRGARHAILDGNVKRVLARHFAVPGWPGRSAVLGQLWALSEALTPAARVAEYNQAMMDIGATLCSRRRPACPRCPLAASCAAHRQGNPEAYPGARPRREQPLRRCCMLLLREPGGAVLLQRRPPQGLWGGLWGFPQFDDRAAALDWCAAQGYGMRVEPRGLAPFRHVFTHFRLDIAPLLVECADTAGGVADAESVWYKGGRPPGGFARPVSRLLAQLDIPHQPPEPPRE